MLMRHPNGSELELYLHGANVVSWRKGDGTEILYLRPDNGFDGVSPILCAALAGTMDRTAVLTSRCTVVRILSDLSIMVPSVASDSMLRTLK